jgi:FAD/FMN-containing dehydrogenase
MLNTEILGLDLPAPDAILVAPGDAEWDVVRRAWNVAVDQQPALVAMPADAGDVVAVMRYARAHGLAVAPQGTGHNASALASLERTILVQTQRMRGVEIDPEAQTARVQAGTLWLEVTEASTPHGLFPLSGSSPDVGVVGYTLGGGLSWLAREHGLAANHVTAIELVTPDGELVRATPEEHADLFWALRGGGGNFGVVTAMEFRLFPYGEVYAGMFLFPYERAEEVLAAWYEWTRTAPEQVTTSMRVLHLPPLPELPDFLRGRSVVVVDGAYAGPGDAGAAAVAALRALGPELDTWGMMTPVALSRLHMDPEEPMPYGCAHTLLGELGAGALEAFAEGVRPGSPLLFGELRHLGGALARTPAAAGALTGLAGEYLFFTCGLALDEAMAEAVHRAGAEIVAALSPYDTGRAYLNFAGAPTDAATFYTDEDYARLQGVRAAVDPEGRMLGNHPIPAA